MATPRSGLDRYSGGAIVFHWTIALLVILNVLLVFGHEWFDWRSMPAHKAIGILVLLLSVARLGWRLTHRPPPFADTVRPWEKALAKATHWLFYLLIIALPLTGWWFSSSAVKRRPLDFFGLFDIPYLPVMRDAGVTGALHDAHETLGLVTIALVLLHVAAALRHHFLLRDTTLLRMLPLRRNT